jgi:hypothetical protein
MKRTILLSCLSLSLFDLTALALVNLGEGEITLSATGSVYYDSEIRARNTGQEDMVLTLRTGLTYSRPSKAFDFSTTLGITAQRYLDFDEFDEENFFFDLSFSPRQEVRTSRLQISGNLILDSDTRSDEELGEIITTRTYGASLGVLYDPNRSYNLRLTASATRDDPDSDRYSEQDRLSLGLTGEIPINQSAFAELGGSYQKTDSDQVSAAAESDTVTAFAGLSGQLSSKLSASIRGGLQMRETNGLGDDTAPYAAGSLNWAIDETSSLNLTLSRSFGTTLDDRASELTSARLGARRQLNRRLSGTIGLEYSKDDFKAVGLEERSDEENGLFAGLFYDLGRNTSLSLDIRYTDQSSNDLDFDFERWRAGISASGKW